MTFIGCNDSEVMEQGTSTIEERIPVTLNVAIPLADLPSSRAITDDSAIHNYEIWVFSKGQLYERIKPGDMYQGESKVELSGDGELKLLLPEGLQDVTLAMVANVNNISELEPSLNAGMLDLNNYTDYMPMFGTTDITKPFDIPSEANGQVIVLRRALAKVEVRAKEAMDHFELSGVAVYRYQDENDEVKILETFTGVVSNESDNRGYIYLPPIASLTEGNTKTCVVFKGKYKNEEFDRYCKMDFIQRIESGNVITYKELEAIKNNHQYIFDIQYLTDSPVYQNVGDALKNNASNFVTEESTELITIDNEHIMDITTNNYIYLGVTAGEVETSVGQSYHVANVSIVTNGAGWNFEDLPSGVEVSIPSYQQGDTPTVVSVWVYLNKETYTSGSSVTLYVYGNNIRKSITVRVPKKLHSPLHTPHN